MTLEEMTLEDALDMVLKQAEAYHSDTLPAWAEGSESDDAKFLRMDRDNSVKALEMVEDAVLRYMKIEKEFDKLQDIIKKKESYSRCVYSELEHELNGKASIVVEDGNVRAES